MAHPLLADMPLPALPSRERRHVFHDGSSRLVHCVDQEVPFPEGHMIVSRVDVAGIITHANEAFVAISGYTRAQLVGAPHSILRHPDMPRAAFANLWAVVRAGGKWQGYVKNLRRDGRCYWVHATVVPNVRHGITVGYTSVRRQASRRKIAEHAAAYADMLRLEQRAP